MSVIPLCRFQIASIYLVENWRNHLVVDHVLVCRRRKDLVKLIGLVAHSTRTHGEFNLSSLDAICRDDNTTVLAHFTVIASSASDYDIDVCLFASGSKQVHVGGYQALWRPLSRGSSRRCSCAECGSCSLRARGAWSYADRRPHCRDSFGGSPSENALVLSAHARWLSIWNGVVSQ
jgi:hypothetical protein